ncbi:hypothetical protein QBC46DRAFT_389057 [Diplogelasinospora grovesii]|uniref:Gamma-butyrobetaine dioxygenase n=1 Tax=Diplogelasinospora grovesii TaxID=303347 RepID=A0AAN6S3T6_9PEZI|nr:hypothetical protein QBC46DRAFT_389057 [Diplogelasinospora grovesii]
MLQSRTLPTVAGLLRGGRVAPPAPSSAISNRVLPRTCGGRRLSTRPAGLHQRRHHSNQVSAQRSGPGGPKNSLYGTPSVDNGKLKAVKVHKATLSLDFGKVDSREPLNISSLWLRDACTCPLCVDPDSGQKNFSTCDIPDVPEVQSAEVANDGSLTVVWKGDNVVNGSDDGLHKSVWSDKQVQEWRSDLSSLRSPHIVPARRTLWNRSVYEQLWKGDGSCTVSYMEWMQDPDAFWRAFAKLCETGLIFVTDVPDAEFEVEKIASKIGILQHTFYGFTWDVKSKPRAENVAYTSQFLGLHQDLMYHIPIPRLQLLHCLANSCEGGESLFSDGFRAAMELKLNRPDLYGALTEPSVNFHYKKGQHSYEMVRRTIEETHGHLETLHWSPPFQAPFRRDSITRWKPAATAFQRSLSEAENMVEVKLKPGECVIFDNWRVLHGRQEFATSGGSRWLKGAYISDQVHRAVEDQLQERNGITDPDIERFRSRLADEELDQVASLLGTTRI